VTSFEVIIILKSYCVLRSKLHVFFPFKFIWSTICYDKMVPKRRKTLFYFTSCLSEICIKLFTVCRVIRNVRNSHVEGLTIFLDLMRRWLWLWIERNKFWTKWQEQPFFWWSQRQPNFVPIARRYKWCDFKSYRFRSGLMKRKLSRKQIWIG